MGAVVTCFVTGATGFVGEALVKRLTESTDIHMRLLVRKSHKHLEAQGVMAVQGDLTSNSLPLSGTDVVIHCAARAHIMNDPSCNPLEAFRKVNVEGTLNIARQAADAGVKRFIFISSIKVNGERTAGFSAFSESDEPSPTDPYAISKMEAETGLLKLSAETGIEVVIIRPPLVYGPKVKANFYSLMKLASTGMPLPFGATHNVRSMVYVGNLVDFITKCIDHPAAANQIFLISDGQDLSLTELLGLFRSSMAKSARLIPVPVFLFHIIGFCVGKRAMVDRLVSSLRVDSSKAFNLLGWRPPYTIAQGVGATVCHFTKSRK
jgi:nucleoside-diphosphate-sugar epimerase